MNIANLLADLTYLTEIWLDSLKLIPKVNMLLACLPNRLAKSIKYHFKLDDVLKVIHLIVRVSVIES